MDDSGGAVRAEALSASIRPTPVSRGMSCWLNMRTMTRACGLSCPTSRAADRITLPAARAWYQAIPPMTAIDTAPNSVALSRNIPNRAPVLRE